MGGGKAGRAADASEAIEAASGRRWFTLLQRPWGFNADRFVVRWTGWSFLSSISSRLGHRPYTPVLLLTTIGASSGQLRVKVLPYVPYDGGYVLIGSNFGGPKDPAWVSNIRANANCWVRVRRTEMAARGTVTTGDERSDVLATVLAAKPNVAGYIESAGRYDRELPLVLVRPIAP